MKNDQSTAVPAMRVSSTFGSSECTSSRGCNPTKRGRPRSDIRALSRAAGSSQMDLVDRSELQPHGGMMRGKITKRLVDAMGPGPRDIYVWDQTLMSRGP